MHCALRAVGVIVLFTLCVASPIARLGVGVGQLVEGAACNTSRTCVGVRWTVTAAVASQLLRGRLPPAERVAIAGIAFRQAVAGKSRRQSSLY